MGITIKKLNLSLHIGESNADDTGKNTVNANQSTLNDNCCTTEKEHDAIVNDAVRQVLEILKEQQER